MVTESMSLRARIIVFFAVFFAAALVLTLGVGSFIGARVAARALESSLRERTVDLARTIADELALSPHTDPDRAARQLGAILTRRRGLRSAQLSIRHGREMKTIHVAFGEEGSVLDTSTDPSSAIPTTTEVVLVDDGGARAWRVELPLRDGGGRTYGALRLEASLSQAEEIVTRERSVFFLVAGVGAALMAGLSSLVLGRWLTRPLTRLAGAMEAVASGAVDETHVPGTERADEVGVVARGLSGMLARIRRFNSELQGKVDEAVAGQARKNRELADVNQQLVEARRDLTTKERLAALGQISGTIAHELGNPLNAISGHIQLLARDPDTPAETRAGLATVERPGGPVLPRERRHHPAAPLRERREDIPLLAEHFAAKHGRPEGAAVTPEARELLLGYDWPGNVRELENVVARALALNHAGLVVPEDLPERVRGLPPGVPPPGSTDRPTLAEVERRYAAQVLAETGGNKTRAAEILGIDRKTLYRIMGAAGGDKD